VVVEETGSPEGDPFLPYSRIEVEAGTGRAVLVTTVPDDDYRGVVHQVRAVRLDLGTGAVGSEPGADEVATFPDARTREAAVVHHRDGDAAP
jgi:hypothetical protein